MPGRRDNHAGTAYYDRARGKWRGEVTLGTRPDGHRDVRKVSGDSRAEVLRLLADLRKAHERGDLGTVDQERETVEAFVTRWLAAKAATVRATSLKAYAERLRGHVVPHLGATRLRALTPAHLQTVYATLIRAGLHPRTVRSVHRALSAALGDAVRWGHLPRNVAQAVAPPAVPATEITPPAAGEVARLLAAAERADDRLRALWALAALTGMRLGELTGLRWDDVDLDGGRVRVRRSLAGVLAGVPTFHQPKTARSKRTIPLSAPAVAALRAHRGRQAAERLKLPREWGLGVPAALAGGGLVFPTEVGTPLRHTNVGVHWRQALKRAGLPATVRFHDLRHFAATSMLAAGNDVASVSAILGHSSPAITLGVYSHAVPDRLSLATDTLAQALALPAAAEAV